MLAFDPIGHRYSWNGREAVNVTRVLPQPHGLLMAKLSDVERKQQLGSAVHRAIQLDLNGELDEADLDDELRPWLAAWREFRAATGFEALMVETRLYSEIHGYAGTPDVAGYLRARLSTRMQESIVLLDFKCTCAAPPPTTGPQLAAYAQLLQELLGKHIKERYALWLRPGERPSHRLVPFSNDNDLATFLSFLRTYKWKKDNGYEE